MLTDFQNSFTGRLTCKFATNSYLNIPPHLKYVVTLPCEIWMSENCQQSEICIVINDKSQDNTAKHLSYDGLLHYKFVNHCAGKRIFKIRGHVRHFVATCMGSRVYVTAGSPSVCLSVPSIDSSNVRQPSGLLLSALRSVATRLRCGGIFKYELVANLPVSLPVKEF